ncbi:MAG: VCBS repeat-containing protein [Bacteroidia bacterium]|nr:VCBS repeat-containing protein [Bacteroidia bacterium]
MTYRSISWILLSGALLLPLRLMSQSGSEICNNGLDDDGDRLVDTFDPDCPARQDGYFGWPNDSCRPDTSVNFDFSIRQEYTTPANRSVAVYVTPKVADLDGDGKAEIIALNGEDFRFDSRISRNIHIFRGEDGSWLRTIDTPWIGWNTIGILAVADIDNDGQGEIVVASANLETLPLSDVICFVMNKTGVLNGSLTSLMVMCQVIGLLLCPLLISIRMVGRKFMFIIKYLTDKMAKN